MSSLGTCLICTCSYRPDTICVLPCGHTFHFDCALQWIQTSTNCPSCRKRCTERNIIRNIYFNFDGDTTILDNDDELNSVKKQLHEKKQECVALEKKLKSALSESAISLKERNRWQKKAEEGADAMRKVGQLQNMLVDQSDKEKEIKELRTKLKATTFYRLIVSGGSEEKMNKYIRSDGEVDTGHFLTVLKRQLTEANDKVKEEKKKREEAESKIYSYKRLVQELKGKEQNDVLVERLNQFSDEKRLSFGGEENREQFSDSFLGSAVRPALKGRINIPAREEEDCNTILGIPSTSRRPISPSTEKDIFDDVRIAKNVKIRIGHSEKMSNGMGSTHSMNRPFDRHMIPISDKENRAKPYERVVSKKKIAPNNMRLSDFYLKKKTNEPRQEDLNSTICID